MPGFPPTQTLVTVPNGNETLMRTFAYLSAPMRENDAHQHSYCFNGYYSVGLRAETKGDAEPYGRSLQDIACL